MKGRRMDTSFLHITVPLFCDLPRTELSFEVANSLLIYALCLHVFSLNLARMLCSTRCRIWPSEGAASVTVMRLAAVCRRAMED